jgi:diadenosine tetraphosphate (Ap4A) HIT family hydrolase
LKEQAKQWNDRPLYLFDEWIAYTNGSETGRELNHEGWYYELLQAHNFNVYCLYLAKTVKEKCPEYDDTQMKSFMMWNIERTFRLAAPFHTTNITLNEPEQVSNKPNKHLHSHFIPYGNDFDSDPTKMAMDYVNKVQTLEEAEEIRTFAKDFLGKDWCKYVYGF